VAHDLGLQLPPIVVGKSDLTRLRRELESLEEYLHQAALRKESPETLKLPKTSRLLDELVQLNGFNLLHRADHERAKMMLEQAATKAPQLHFSFSVEPSSAFLAKLTTWVRQNIHPQALIQVGLQPSIAAGCVVRTANKQFDLSLRQSFEKHKTMLAEQLRSAKP
jgi:F0F1-type ATP synthase delta subunit